MGLESANLAGQAQMTSGLLMDTRLDHPHPWDFMGSPASRGCLNVNLRPRKLELKNPDRPGWV